MVQRRLKILLHLIVSWTEVLPAWSEDLKPLVGTLTVHAKSCCPTLWEPKLSIVADTAHWFCSCPSLIITFVKKKYVWFSRIFQTSPELVCQASSHNFISVIFGIFGKFGIEICEHIFFHRNFLIEFFFDRKNRKFFGRKKNRSKKKVGRKKIRSKKKVIEIFCDDFFFRPNFFFDQLCFSIDFFSIKKIRFFRSIFFRWNIFDETFSTIFFCSHISIPNFPKIPKITLRKLCDEAWHTSSGDVWKLEKSNIFFFTNVIIQQGTGEDMSRISELILRASLALRILPSFYSELFKTVIHYFFLYGYPHLEVNRCHTQGQCFTFTSFTAIAADCNSTLRSWNSDTGLIKHCRATNSGTASPFLCRDIELVLQIQHRPLLHPALPLGAAGQCAVVHELVEPSIFSGFGKFI